MNKGFKKILVSFFFVFTLLSVGTKNVAAAQLGAQQNQDFDFNNLIDAFYSSLRTVKNLNYYTNDKVVFVIAGQEVSFDIQAGHGNIFTPLKPVAAKISPVRFGASNTEASDKASLSGFARVVIENELYKNAKDVEILKWLIDFKLNPVQLLTFKFLILLNTARADGEWSRVIEESFCLLFRLSQVDDLEFIDKNKRLSTYLPESLKTVLKDNKFGLIEFIDDLWTVLINNPDYNKTSKNPVQIKNFIFRDEVMAKLVFEQFKNYTGTNNPAQDPSQNATTLSLQDQINSFIKPQGYGIVDINDFVKFRADISIPNNKFAQTMVGYEEFSLSNNSDKPVDLTNQINALQTKLPKLIFAHDQRYNEYLVAYVTEDMSLINTLKEVLITLCSSFKEYLQVKKTIFAKTDEASSKYKAEFTRKEKCRIELEKFVRSPEGNQIFNQIKGEIETIIFGADESTVEKSAEQNRQEQITSLKAELAKLENQKNEKTEQLAKWEKLFTLQNASDIHDKIVSLKFDISNIDIQILAIQKDLTNLVSEKLREVNKFDGASVEKDKQNLAKLYTILEEKQKAGGVPSDKLLSTIKTLEDRIAQSTAQPVAQKSIDGKLAVRAAVANILEIKANELSAQIYSKLNELDLIKDIEDKAIQELMLDETVSLQKTFVKQLEATAKQIRQDSEKAKMLEAYRKAFSSVGTDKISKEKLDQITKLELEIGHIIDSEKQEDFVAKIMLRESFLSEFVQDITKHADQFMYVKERLQNSLTQILSHSSHFKANAKLYRYLWKTIPGNYKTFLGCVGITEQSLS
ncbi:MAG: hypothetical protein WC192_00340 [Candidatus Babeliales bacterium]|jgi:hypothetical protein